MLPDGRAGDTVRRGGVDNRGGRDAARGKPGPPASAGGIQPPQVALAERQEVARGGILAQVRPRTVAADPGASGREIAPSEAIRTQPPTSPDAPASALARPCPCVIGVAPTPFEPPPSPPQALRNNTAEAIAVNANKRLKTHFISTLHTKTSSKIFFIACLI